MLARKHRGSAAYHAGLAAEASVADHYERQGCVVEKRRWRGKGGEIDLILRDKAGLIFVEVKKSRDFAAAVQRITQRQMHRILTAAEEFLGGEPMGSLTEARVDVALVNGHGQVEVVENAFGHS